MLSALSIRNFAIIEHLDLEFGPGFNVLTGETGAGKSILIDALSLILGARADATMVRGGVNRASVDAVFHVAGELRIQQMVEEMGYELDNDSLYLSRDILSSGKSNCRIAGRPATVAQLKDLGEWLVDLHGQHEHQSLLSVSRHLDMLDDWAGKSVYSLRAQVAEAFQTLRRLKHEKAELETDARERAHLIDLYEFQVKEITDARPKSGEDAELESEHLRISSAQKLAEAAQVVVEALSGGDSGGGALPALALAARVLEEAVGLDETLRPALEAIRSASYELEETERDLVRYPDTIEFNPERLEQIEERLELLRTLKRKYGDTIEEILQYSEETSLKLDTLSHSEERGAKLFKEIEVADKRLRTFCTKLSAERRKAATEFQKITLSELCDLAMEKTRFEVRIEQGEPTSLGSDRVEFLIATNPGEPLRPLAKVASGGEISRVMLAIKSALARKEPLPTMIFDEIDVGVGGRTASFIADKLAALATTAQVLAITHLAQIASRATTHIYIEKIESKDRTVVSVTLLDAEQRVGEVARMIGGTELTDAVLQHAREMLAHSQKSRV